MVYAAGESAQDAPGCHQAWSRESSVREGGGEVLAEEGLAAVDSAEHSRETLPCEGSMQRLPEEASLPFHTPVSQGPRQLPRAATLRSCCPGLAWSPRWKGPRRLCSKPLPRGLPRLATGDITRSLEGRVFLSEFPARYTEESNVGLAYGLTFKLWVPTKKTLGNGNREQGLTFYFREQLQRRFHKKASENFFFWLKKDKER